MTDRSNDETAGNAVPRDRLRSGIVDCPLCGRQIARPHEHLVVFGPADDVGVGEADAIQCPACSGVTFVVDRSERTD